MTTQQSDLRNALTLLIAIAIAWSPGFLGAIFFATGDDSWYQQLDKPWFNPPNWVFGPVWSILYIGIGVSLYLVWTRGERAPEWNRLMVVFAIMLVLNGLWTPAFFGLESPVAGLVVIIPMLISIAATIWLARPFSGVAALLLVPYFLWVSFATVLNAAIWQLN
ncbi:MAG: tryptophan-rich sensory protein [Sphaerobacteraceae bacterium]|nr:MAG: tryptophan-rich sensory protein [Sphaerobacteraceae bacterium]